MSLDLAARRSCSPGVAGQPTLLLALTGSDLVARSSHLVAFH
jgi:hypothetical protein